MMIQISEMIVLLMLWVQAGSTKHLTPEAAEVQDLSTLVPNQTEPPTSTNQPPLDEEFIVMKKNYVPKQIFHKLFGYGSDHGIDINLEFDQGSDGLTLEATSKIKLKKCKKNKKNKCRKEVEDEEEIDGEDDFEGLVIDVDDDDDDEIDDDDGDDGDDDDGDDAFIDDDYYDEDDYDEYYFDQDYYDDDLYPDEYQYEDEYGTEEEYDYDKHEGKKPNTEKKKKEGENNNNATEKQTTSDSKKDETKDNTQNKNRENENEDEKEKDTKEDKKDEAEQSTNADKQEKVENSTLLLNDVRREIYEVLKKPFLHFRPDSKNLNSGFANTVVESPPKINSKMRQKKSFNVTTLSRGSPKDAYSDVGIPFDGLQHHKLGGARAPNTGAPYQVSFRIGDMHFCSGSIIGKRWILTAAHCIVNKTAGSFSIVAGTNSLKLGGDVYATEHLISHPSYNPNLSKNDIALVRVGTDIRFTDRIKYINLAKHNTLDGKPLVLSGWGYIDNDRKTNSDTTQDWLQWLQVWSVNSDECRRLLTRTLGIIGSSMDGSQMCAFLAYGHGSCKGDSGDPLRENLELVGINTFHTPCALGQPYVFTRVFFYLDWIYSQVY